MVFDIAPAVDDTEPHGLTLSCPSELLHGTFTLPFVQRIVEDPMNFEIDSRLKMPLRVYRIVI